MKNKSAREVIRNFINKDPQYLLLKSLTEISQEINFSQSTIVKEIKNLGYKGFKDLKRRIYIEGQINENENIDDNLLLQSIIATDKRLENSDIIDKFINLIETQKIAIQGFGECFELAKIFSYQLNLLGLKTIAIEFKEPLKHFEIDVLICVSSRGISKINKEILNYAKSCKIKTILISDINNKIKNDVDLYINFINFQNDQGTINIMDKLTLINFIFSQLFDAINYKINSKNLEKSKVK